MPSTSDIGVEKTATRETVPSSRIGTATWPSSTCSAVSAPVVVRPVRAATSATSKRRWRICTSRVESEKIANCSPSVPSPTVMSVTRMFVRSLAWSDASMSSSEPLLRTTSAMSGV